MPFVPAKCTQCGAAIQIDNTREAGICIHCQMPFITEKAVNNYISQTHHNTQNIDQRIIVKNIVGKEMNEAEDYIKNGDVFLNLEEWDNARKQYRKAIDSAPADWRGWFGLVKVATENFTYLADDSHLQDLEKALAVATEQDKRVIEKLYDEYGKQQYLSHFGIEDGILTKYTGRDNHVIIPDGVMEIGNSSFNKCFHLNSVAIPSSVTTIGAGAFAGCGGLKSITIPDSVTEIGGGAFKRCTELTSITIPHGITSINYNLFSDCTALKNIIIPDSVTKIENEAFLRCTALKNIIIPDSVTKIGCRAFLRCTALTNIIIPHGITSIGDQLFCDCTALTNIKIPDSVWLINYGAFSKCTGLTSISIPDSVKIIHDGVFFGWEKTQTIYVNKKNSKRWHKRWKECCRANIIYRK